MAAVLEKQEATAKNSSQVDEQIAQATSRIRAHDLTFGGLVLVALLLVYATAMIVLDRSLNLPEWVRQVSLAAFLGVVVATAYLTLISPLRKRINPLYAAKQVERTIDDAKNSVTGYVDAQQKADLNPTVKAALASKAAKAAAEVRTAKPLNQGGSPNRRRRSRPRRRSTTLPRRRKTSNRRTPRPASRPRRSWTTRSARRTARNFRRR
jgi:hypothetical protein